MKAPAKGYLQTQADIERLGLSANPEFTGLLQESRRQLRRRGGRSLTDVEKGFGLSAIRLSGSTKNVFIKALSLPAKVRAELAHKLMILPELSKKRRMSRIAKRVCSKALGLPSEAREELARRLLLSLSMRISMTMLTSFGAKRSLAG